MRTMRWNIKRGLLLAATLGATACSLGSFAGVASAAPYDRTDPVTTGCSNSAITLASTPILDPLASAFSGATIGRVELRYSTACRTKWARIDSYIGGRWMEAYAARQDGVNTWGAGGDGVQAFYGTQVYSDQLYGDGMRVCAYGRLLGYWGGWTSGPNGSWGVQACA